MIRWAFFDVGNVLLFFSHERMCRQLAEVYGCAPEAVRSLLFESGLAEEYDRGRTGTDEVFERLAGLARKPVEKAAAIEAAADIFELNHPIVPLVESLAETGLRLGLLSNTCEVHSRHFLATFDVMRRFDARILSHEIGAGKPEAAIFEAAVERSGCGAGECFFVDDIAEYAGAARRAGLRAVTYSGVVELARSLRELGVEIDAVD